MEAPARAARASGVKMPRSPTTPRGAQMAPKLTFSDLVRKNGFDVVCFSQTTNLLVRDTSRSTVSTSMRKSMLPAKLASVRYSASKLGRRFDLASAGTPSHWHQTAPR